MKRYIILLFFIPLLGFSQTIPSDKNAIIHSKFRVATTNEADASDPNKAVITIAYIDGLGRGLQMLGYRQSPIQKDIVSGAVEFDGYGRLIKTALTSPTTNNTGTYQSNAFGLANTFYSDSYAYTETSMFDNSPLNRVREQYGAGEAWRTNNKSIQMFEESVGTDVRLYHLDGSNNIILSGTYPANSLYKKRLIDEQGHTSIEISDKHGNLVQREQQDGGITTYFIYDVIGRLLAVIQPQGYELNSSISYNSSDFQKFVFFYEYNERNQVAHKHTPSGGWTSMVYDRLNRVVLVQDAGQAVNNRWNFNKYDALGRTIIIGELTNNSSRSTLQSAFNSISTAYEVWNNGYSNQSFPISYGATDEKMWNFYDTYDWIAGEWAFNAGIAYNASSYWSNAQGLLTGSFARSTEDPNKVFHLVKYYDTQQRVIQTFQVHQKGGGSPWTKPIITNYEYNFAGEITKEKVLYQIDGLSNTESQTVHEYDYVGRLLKVYHGINTTPTEVVRMSYDELGRVQQKKILPNGTYLVGGVRDYIRRPTIDGIVTQNNTEDLARKAVILEPTNDIKAINLTTYVARIDPNAQQGVNINGLQTINFAWHLRGGLLGINLDNNGNAIPKASEGDLFSYKLDYETAGFYDGNIGKQSWQGVNDQNQAIGLRSYSMTYDPLKRMTGASFVGINGENYTLSGLSYDKNGNIKTMQRNGKTSSGFGLMDNLNYVYDGNKLNTVTDGVSATDNEVDLVPRGSGNYTYYTDGNVKSDANEGISLIIYDTFLNQPKEIQLTDGRKINHYYDGAGTLLKTVYSTGEYWEFTPNGMIYKNGQPYQMAVPEGRAVYTGGAWQYEFFYTDHLGNTRVAFRANGNQLVKTSETAFDPWGVVLRGAGQVNAYQNRFEYQDKEKESTFGLNRISLGARTYNPTTGRMDSTDPLAEKFTSWSPYNYALNNPIKFIDPDGNMAVPFDDPLKKMQIRENRASNLMGMVRNGASRPHQGWDLQAPVGTPTYAVKGGTVVLIETGAYGKQIILSFEDENGDTNYAQYAHLSAYNVTDGQKVDEGQLLGETGDTGNAKGVTPHLHFEIRLQKSVGLGLAGREDPNITTDTKFYSQNPNGNQTQTGVVRVNIEGLQTQMNLDGTTTTSTPASKSISNQSTLIVTPNMTMPSDKTRIKNQ